MNLIKDSTLDVFQSRRGARGVEVAAFAAAAAVVVLSAIMAKEAGSAPVLASVESNAQPAMTEVAYTPEVETQAQPEPEAQAPVYPDDTRWFDGRPARPARTIEMVVTAYSPDAASCGQFADGQTATLHSVNTNAGRLVAADTSVLPYGSMLTIEGYADGEIVPVLDCGGAIKGARLDLLFPTHEQAMAWGVRRIEVVVWEYADGKPAPNPRRVR